MLIRSVAVAAVIAVAIVIGAAFGQAGGTESRKVPSASQTSSKLTIKEAQELVYFALPPATKRLPGLGLEPSKDATRDCLTFDILWSNPGPGSAHVMFYTVDLRTGELWSGIPGVYTHIVTDSIIRRQRDIRKRLGVTEQAYRERMAHPCCQ